MRVLLVEDKVGGTLLKLLAKWGYEVFLAEEAERAWEILTSKEIELFLVDWMLPGVSGLELVQRIRRLDQYEETPILMLSSRTSKEDIAQVVQAGVDGYIAKPFTLLQLKAKIEDVLWRKSQDPVFNARIQRIVRGHRAFDSRETNPIVLLGFGAATEEALREKKRRQIVCLERIRAAIETLNAEDPDLKLGYLLVESTNDIARMLARWSLRDRTCMIVVSSDACKGNSVFLVRLLAARRVEEFPFVLLYETDDIPADLQRAAEEGEPLHLMKCSETEVEEWKDLIERYL